MAKFLVTGGCGFIGSHLVDQLLRQGHRVRVLDDLSAGRTHNLAPEAELMIGDVADPALTALALAGVAGCFHLAAAPPDAEDLAAHRTNMGGTLAVFQAARAGAVPVVYASAAAVYGDSADPRQSEMSIARPLSAFGADKLDCELYGRIAASLHGVPTAGLRFFDVYGPRRAASGTLEDPIGRFSACALAGEPIALPGDGEQVRDFIFVADAVAHLTAAMDRLLERQRDRRPAGAGVFNVCTGQATRLRDLATLIGRLSGRMSRLDVLPPGPAEGRAGEIRRSVGDPTAAIRHLRVAATTSLDDGLRQTLTRLLPEPQAQPHPAAPFGVHWSSRLLSQ